MDLSPLNFIGHNSNPPLHHHGTVLIFFSTINNLNGDQAIPTMC